MRKYIFNKDINVKPFTSVMLIVTLLFIFVISQQAFSQSTQTYTGNGTFTVPAGVTSLDFRVWGGGGAGGGATTNSRQGGGGGGGAFRGSAVNVINGEQYTINVGATRAGTTGNGATGNTSSVLLGAATIFSAPGGNGGTANNGAGGAGGAGTNVFGNWAGGNGATGAYSGTAANVRGGGGSSAGNATFGANGSTTNRNGGTAPANGGNGGQGATMGTFGNDGSDGTAPGGGGGGAIRGSLVNYSGGDGARGQVTIIYTCPTYSLASTTTSAVCAGSSATINLSGLPEGNYTVTYNRSAPNAATGQTAGLTISATGTGSFTTATLANAGNTTITITSLTSGSSTGSTVPGILCTSAIGSNNSAVVIVGPIVNAGTALTAICWNTASAPLGGSVGGSATGGTWSSSVAGGTFTPSNTNLNATWTPPLNYIGTVTFTLTNTGCGTAAATKNLTVNGPTANAGTALAAICINSTSIALGGSVSGTATGGMWDDGGVGGAFNPDANTLNATWTPPAAFTGTATLTLTTTGGSCGSTSASKTQQVLPLPLDISPTAPTLTTICAGTATTISIVGSEAGVNYQLRNDAGNINVGSPVAGGGTISLSTGSLNGTTTFNVYAEKALATGCGLQMTGSVTITVTPAPANPSNPIAANNPACVQTTLNAITTGIPSGETYFWQGINGSGIDDTKDASLNPYDITATNTYYVRAQDNTTQCWSIGSGSLLVTINQIPAITVNPTMPSVCQGVTSATLTYTVPTNSPTLYSIVWDLPGVVGPDVTNQPLGASIPIAVNAGAAPAVYTGTLSVSNASCVSANYPITVEVKARPTPTFTSIVPPNTCLNTPVTYTTEAGQGSYAWTYTGTGTGASTTNSINITWTTAGVKNVNVNYTASNGCAATTASVSAPITVNALPVPTFTAQPVAPICANSNVTYSTELGMTNYVWTFSTGTFTVVTGGTVADNFVTGYWNAGANRRANVSYTDGNGCTSSPAITSSNLTVTSVPADPTWSGATPADGASVCANTDVVYRTSTATAWSWNIQGVLNTDYTITGGSLNSRTITVRWITSGSKTVTANVSNGTCYALVPSSKTITVNPRPVVTTASTAVVCSGYPTSIALTSDIGNTYTYTRTLNGATYTSGSTTANPIAQVLGYGTGAHQATYAVTATVTATGCTNSTPYNVVVTVNPTPVVTVGAKTICSNTAVAFAPTVSVASNLTWALSSNPGGITGATDPGAAATTINDVLTNPSNSASGNYVYAVTATSTVAGNCVSNPANVTITVRPTAEMNNPGPYSTCSGSGPSITLVATATSTYAWTIGAGGTGSISGASGGSGGTINQTLTNPSDVTAGTVEYIVTPTLTGTPSCVGTPSSVFVTVNPKPTITTSNASICSGTSPNITLNSTAGSSFAWTLGTRTGVTGGFAGSGATINDILTNTSNSVVGSLIYNVTATTTTGICPSVVTPITVNVTPTPVVTNLNTATACNGTSPNIALTASTPSTFVWTLGAVSAGITGASAGSSAGPSGSNIDDVLNNPSNSVSGTVEYIITPTSNTNGCLGAPYTITVTVFPTPEVNSAPTANACSSIPQIPLNYDILGTASGTTFTWGRLAVSGVSEGTVAGQTADPILETLTNTTAASIPVIYKITPSANGCPGPVFDLVVTVMPRTDAVVNSAASATICTPAAINYTITSSGGPVTGYRWSRQAVSGITNSSVVNATSNPIIETLTNGSIANATVTYAITAMNNGCPGDVFNYVVTVRPTLYLSNQTFEACSLQEFIFGPADASSGVIPEDTKFTWSAPVVTGGITGGSAQSTPQDSVFQTLTNPTGVIKTATYIVSAVSPTACVGGAFQLTVNVNPSVTVNASPAAPSPACSGSPIPTILVTSPTALPGTVLSWTRINTANLTGMGATGNGDISGTLVNNTSTDQVETFTITAEANGCVATTTVDITIRPAATVTVNPASQTACSGESIASIILSSPVSTSFTWNRDNLVDITGLASGSGDIIGSLVNTTNSQKTTIFTITPALASCNGVPITAAVIVNPTPQVTASRNNNNPVCSGQPIEPITVASLNTVIGTVFSWTRNNTTDITGNNSGTGALINEVFVNTTNVPQTTTITITATAGTCSSNTTMDVLVNPSPTILVSPAIQAICSGSGISTITLSDNLASTYSVVSRDNTTSVTGTITGSTSLTGVLTNATTTTQITNLSVTATASASGNCAATATIPVTVYAPLTAPAISESQYLCTGVNPSQFSYGAAPSGGSGLYTYQWQKTTPAGTVWTDVATTMNYTATLANSNADYRVIAIDALCGQETSNVVEIRLIATSQGGSLLGLDNNPNAVYCNSATFTGTFTTLGHPGNYSLRYSWAGNSNYISAPSGPAAGGSTGNTYGRIVIPFLGINAASSTGTIPFVFTNNTNATVNTTLSLYPRVHSWAVAGANGTGGFLCNGAIENHIIAIKPTPVATRNTAQNQSICSETAANISVRSNITDESTRFTWTSSNTTTIQGLPASGDTTVAVGGTFRLLQHLTSTNTTAQTTTITITPQLTSATCNPGAAVTYSITVNGNINPGVFTAEQTVCSGGDPAAFVETVPAAGTTASTPTYVWQSASGTCASPGTFGNISGQTGNEYDIPSGITATRSYRRIVTFVSGATCRDTTACVTIYVNTATAGSIATGSQTICAGSDPSEIGTVAPGSGAGSISYQWESKLGTGCTGLFADVFGATSETYTPPAGLASTTTYRRKTVSNLNGQDCASAVSNCFTVYINSVDAGGIANLTPNNQIFCGANDPVNLTSAPNAAGTATPTYQWQSSVGADCAGSFSNVPSAGTGFNYNPPLLNVTTTYRRIATSLLNSVPCRDTTTCETITILNINPGQIANTQAVCAGATAQPFISVTDATAGGSTDYRWESSTTGLAGSWTPIASTNSNVYTHPDVITGTLYFHRVTFGDISGTACDVATPSISVFLSDPTAGQVDAPLCTSLNPAAFTITTPATGPGGALTYTWERSPDGLAPWTTVTDSTRATLDLNGLSPGTSYYRRIITNTLITGYPCSVTGNIVTVNAYAGTAGDWTGLNGADWFNCANWGAGFVPDNTTPVNIPSVAFKPIINRTSAFITTTDSVAHAANLDVNDLLTFANSNDSLFIGGNLIIDGSGSVVMTTGGNLELRGHWTNNVGPTGFVQHSGNVSLTGASAQQHIFTPQTFDRLRINHTGTGITFDKDVIITDSIEFVNGKINTSASPDGLLTLSPTAKASGASNSSFVNGPMAKETNSTPAGSAEFTFPIGKTLPSNNYQPAGVLPVTHSSGTTTYIAEFIAANPGLLGYSFLGTTLTGILQDKYWEIDRVGTGTARVVLNYQPTAATTTGTGGWVYDDGSTIGVPPPNSTNVAVAHGNGFWDFTKDDGYFEVTTAPFEAIWYKNSGKVYSGEMLSFSPFTIGFGSSTILPVKLLSFNGRILGTDGALSWKIADASDLSGFELQYSADGITFRKLADVPANGGTVYSYLDKQLPIGARYYRLLVKEKSGNSLFSKLLVLTLDGQRTSIVGLANTIVREQQVTGKIISAKSQGVRALVSDVSGRQIKEQRGRLQQGTNRWLIGTGYLAQGMYFVTIITDDGVKATLQFVKE